MWEYEHSPERHAEEDVPGTAEILDRYLAELLFAYRKMPQACWEFTNSLCEVQASYRRKDMEKDPWSWIQNVGPFAFVLEWNDIAMERIRKSRWEYQPFRLLG
jgi:hypothetical protein